MALLRTNRSKLDALAEALLEHETLDEDDAYKVAGVPRRDTSAGVSLVPAARSSVTPPPGATVHSNPKRGD